MFLVMLSLLRRFGFWDWHCFLCCLSLAIQLLFMGLVLLVNYCWCCTILSVVDAFDCVSRCSGHDAYLPFPLPLPLPNLDLTKFYDKCLWSISANCNWNIFNKTLAMEIWNQTWWSHAMTSNMISSLTP